MKNRTLRLSIAALLSCAFLTGACAGGVTGRAINKGAAETGQAGQDAASRAAGRAEAAVQRLDSYASVLEVIAAHDKAAADAKQKELKELLEIIRPALLARADVLKELAAAYAAFEALAEGASDRDFSPQAAALSQKLSQYASVMNGKGAESALTGALNGAYAAYSSDKVLAANAVLGKASAEAASLMRKEIAFTADLESEFIAARRQAAMILWESGALTSAPLLNDVAGGSGFAAATDSAAVSGKACSAKSKSSCALRDMTLAFSERKAREQTKAEKEELEGVIAALEELQTLHRDVASRQKVTLSALRSAGKLFHKSEKAETAPAPEALPQAAEIKAPAPKSQEAAPSAKPTETALTPSAKTAPKAP